MYSSCSVCSELNNDIDYRNRQTQTNQQNTPREAFAVYLMVIFIIRIGGAIFILRRNNASVIIIEDKDTQQCNDIIHQISCDTGEEATHIRQNGQQNRAIYLILQIAPFRPAIHINQIALCILLHQHLADEQEIHHNAHTDGNHRTLEVYPCKIMHGMRRGMCIHEMCAHCRQGILCLVREDPQTRQADCNRAQNYRHQPADIRPIFDRLRCAVGIMFIDLDLRRPVQSEMLGLSVKQKNELGTLLTESAAPEKILAAAVTDPATGLHSLLSTKSYTDVIELLASAQLAKVVALAREQYDYVIIDSPPLGFFSDSELLSDLSDASVLVVRQDTVPAPEINDAIDALRAGKAEFLGCILNDMAHLAAWSSGYGYGYGKKYDKYGYGQHSARKTQ